MTVELSREAARAGEATASGTWGKGGEERRVDDDGMCRGTAAAGRCFTILLFVL